MTKRIVAVTEIIHDGQKFPPNTTVDHEKFTKDQLTRLYERGVIKIVDSSEEDEKQKEQAHPVDLMKENQETEKAPEASEETPKAATTPSPSTTAKNETPTK